MLVTIDALPDALLARVLVLAGRKRCRTTSAVCRRWRRLVFAEPRLWRSVTLSPGLLPRLAKKDKQRWFSSQHALLRRVAPLVEAAAVEGGSSIEAAGAATGKWGLADLLSPLDANKLMELSIQGPWELPAAALRALGRLTGLSDLKLDGTRLPGGELLAALGQLSALRSFELSTDEPPLGLPGALAQLSRLQALRWDVAEAPLDVGELFSLPCSLTSIQLGVRHEGVLYMSSPAQLPALQRFYLYTAGWFTVGMGPCFKAAYYSAEDPALLLINPSGLPAEPGGLNWALGCLLPRSTVLSTFTLDTCSLGRSAVSGCARLAALTLLQLSRCSPAPGALGDLLRQLPGLLCLSVNHGSFRGHGSAAELASLSADCPTLRVLSLQFNELRSLPDIDLTGPQLRTLYLSNNKLQPLPSVLASATSLGSLLLGGNPHLTVSNNDVRSVLAAMPALASLAVCRGVLGRRVAKRISKLCPELTVTEEAGPGAYQPPRSEASGSSDEESEL